MFVAFHGTRTSPKKRPPEVTLIASGGMSMASSLQSRGAWDTIGRVSGKIIRCSKAHRVCLACVMPGRQPDETISIYHSAARSMCLWSAGNVRQRNHFEIWVLPFVFHLYPALSPWTSLGAHPVPPPILLVDRHAPAKRPRHPQVGCPSRAQTYIMLLAAMISCQITVPATSLRLCLFHSPLPRVQQSISIFILTSFAFTPHHVFLFLIEMRPWA